VSHPYRKCICWIKNSEAVITISSPVALEVLIRGAPVVVFGRLGYRKLDTIRVADRYKELTEVLVDTIIDGVDMEKVTASSPRCWQPACHGTIRNSRRRCANKLTRNYPDTTNQSTAERFPVRCPEALRGKRLPLVPIHQSRCCVDGVNRADIK